MGRVIFGLDGVQIVNFPGSLGEGPRRGAWVIACTLCVLWENPRAGEVSH
jgi:hypothetical protein